MSLISQAVPEKSGVSKLLRTAGHPVVEPIDKKIEFIPTFARERKSRHTPSSPPEFNFGAFRSVAAIRHRFFCLLFQPGDHPYMTS